MCNGAKGGIAGEGESQRNNIKRSNAEAWRVFLSLTNILDEAAKFLKELSPGRQGLSAKGQKWK